VVAAKLAADRYGRKEPRIPARWRYGAGFLILALALGAFVLFAYRNLGSQPIETEQTGFEVTGEHSIRIEFTVTRDNPARPADCIIKARSRSGDETGRREVYVKPGADATTQTASVRTAEEAVTGEVYGCSYGIPPYLSREPPPSG
jgi:hypothetical protein